MDLLPGNFWSLRVPMDAVIIDWKDRTMHSSRSELTSKPPGAQEVPSHICSVDVP